MCALEEGMTEQLAEPLPEPAYYMMSMELDIMQDLMKQGHDFGQGINLFDLEPLLYFHLNGIPMAIWCVM